MSNMTKFLSKRDSFSVFASVLLSVFMVAVVAYGASVIDTNSVGVGTSTPGTGLYVASGMASVLSGEAYIFGQTNLSYFIATSTTATSTILYGLDVATTSLRVDGNSGAVTIGTSSVPNSDNVANTTVTPSFTVSGVGDTYGATGTVYVAGGGAKGGEIIIKSSDGKNCVSLMAQTMQNTTEVAIGASATLASNLLTAKVVACPK